MKLNNVRVIIKTTFASNQNKIMNKGTVKFFNESKGFGFIKDESSDTEYFVHVSGLKNEIKENDEVSFDLQEGRKGLNAVNVTLR